jgi:hypothetical protein
MIPDRRARDAPPPPPSINLGIYFDDGLDQWAHRDGVPVCQEHARAYPCPYHRRAEDRPAPALDRDDELGGGD